MTKLGVVGSEIPAETYLVNVALPNQVGFPGVPVAKSELVAGSDVLIGMDIITRGDFSITNVGGRTVFSYRIPSLKLVDFVAEIEKIRPQQRGMPQGSRPNLNIRRKNKKARRK